MTSCAKSLAADMTKVQQVFEALMRSKGHADFNMRNGKYSVPSLQVRWTYFQMGWNMHEVTA
jgi:hypothetical protein